MSIEAMKLYLEALEWASAGKPITCKEVLAMKTRMQDLRKAIEEAEKQEPVAWMTETGSVCSKSFKAEVSGHIKYQERYCIPLYTHPPKREWIDIDYRNLLAMRGGDIAFLAGVQWAEDKLKELNHVL